MGVFFGKPCTRESLGGRVKEAGRERTMDERKVDDIAHQIKVRTIGLIDIEGSPREILEALF